MAHKKGQGSSRNGRDSNPQHLGVKAYGGQTGDGRLDHRAAARHPLLPRHRTSAAARTTPSSPRVDGVVKFQDKGQPRQVRPHRRPAPPSRSADPALPFGPGRPAPPTRHPDLHRRSRHPRPRRAWRQRLRRLPAGEVRCRRRPVRRRRRPRGRGVAGRRRRAQHPLPPALRERSTRAERGRHGEGSNKTGKSAARPRGAGAARHPGLGRDSGDFVGEVLARRRAPARRLPAGAAGAATPASPRRRTRRRAAPTRGRRGRSATCGWSSSFSPTPASSASPTPGNRPSSASSRRRARRSPTTRSPPSCRSSASSPRARSPSPSWSPTCPGSSPARPKGRGSASSSCATSSAAGCCVHLVDLSELGGEESSAVEDLETVERELGAFNPDLLARPRLLVGSKLDAALPERRAELAGAAAERGLPYMEISSATGEGVPRLVSAIARGLEAAKAAEKAGP